MKRVISIVLALLMLVSLAACSSSGGETAAQTQNDGKYHVGVLLHSKDDALGGKMYALLNDCAEAMGCEITFAIGDFDTTAQMASVENLIAAGVDGILVLPMAETTTQKMNKICKDNGVYFGILLRTINDPATNEETRSNPYFVGNILGDDIGNANELTRIMIEELGKKNLCVYYAPEGTSLALRNEGIREAIKQYGGTQLAEAQGPADGNTAPINGVIQNFVNTNPNFEGLVAASGSVGAGETYGSSLLAMNVEGAKYATFDTFAAMGEYFANGTLGVVCGGQQPACVYLFSLLYNAMDGHPLTETGMELKMPYMFIRSEEQADDFLNYIDNPETSLYSAEEIQQMTIRYNPDFTWEALEKMVDEYSYDTVIGKFK